MRLNATSIQPIHESGSQKYVENYRPISLLSSLPEILDKIVADEFCDRACVN